jgi:peptidoglycan hydrolase CwlO-like protein
VLEDVAQTMSERELSEKQRSDLYSLMQGCRNVLKDLDTILDKYKDLGASSQNLKARSQRAWNKVRWDQDQITELRHRIVSNMAILDAFNTSLTRSAP